MACVLSTVRVLQKLSSRQSTARSFSAGNMSDIVNNLRSLYYLLVNTAVSASPCVVSTKYSNTFLKLDVLPAPDLPVNTMDWVDREFTAVLDRKYFV